MHMYVYIVIGRGNNSLIRPSVLLSHTRAKCNVKNETIIKIRNILEFNRASEFFVPNREQRDLRFPLHPVGLTLGLQHGVPRMRLRTGGLRFH